MSLFVVLGTFFYILIVQFLFSIIITFLPWDVGDEYVLFVFSLAIMTLGMAGAAKLWLMIFGLTWPRLPDVFIDLAVYWAGVSVVLFWPDEYWNIFLSFIQCLVYFFTARYFLGRKDTV